MSWLCTKTTDRYRLVYQGDPAVDSEGDEWIPFDRADFIDGSDPDVFECRPLNSDECFRIIQATQKDNSFLSFAATFGVTSIESGGETITEPKEIQAILDNAQNMAPIMRLSQSIFQISREGLGALPFRDPCAPVE